MSFYSKITTIIIISLAAIPLIAAADYGGQQTTFFVDSSYDLLGRERITATLLRITPSLYFYVDDNWWNALAVDKQVEVKTSLQDLGEEFTDNAYPALIGAFGSEWNPGIDKDAHITVLVHPMTQEAGGYTNPGDEYSIYQAANSNQREMIYLNTAFIADPLAKSFLAHEFVHLITFNQKNRKQGIVEEVWLNEARADYAPTFLGYDEPFSDSIISRRVNDFLKSPNDPLAEWKNKKEDYGVLNLFFQYLVDHYGLEVLSRSLRSSKKGIPSINEALQALGFEEDFAQIFTDWTVAVYLNDCSIALDSRYCYKNEGLQDIQVTPALNFLPLIGKSTLAVTATTKNWAGNWYKFIGGRGTLKIEFIGYPDVSFRAPYITQDILGSYEVNFLELDANQQAKVLIPDFGTIITSLVLVPSIQSKTLGFNSDEESYSFFWSASTMQTSDIGNNNSIVEEPANPEWPVPEPEKNNSQTEDIQALLKKIEFLEKQLALLHSQLKEQLTGMPAEPTLNPYSSQSLDNNLRFGDRGADVEVLQSWLSQDAQIYPEGIVTGFFGPLTQAAVIKFQEKYASEILISWNLTRGTGFVGQTTRSKLNQLYNK